MAGKHAKLSASAAHRWLLCPPSAVLESKFPDSTSDAAAEGTEAHELAELIVRYNAGLITKNEFRKEKLAFQKKAQFYDGEMEEATSGYANFVWEQFNEAKSHTPDAKLFIEQRLDFSEYVEQGWGTGDIVILADDILHVIDLKYGKGVKVEAPGNPQLRLYGLGAVSEYEDLYDIQQIQMTIVQPRLDHISTETLPIQELKDWGEKEVKPIAELAYIGEGEFLPGEEQCRFCRAKNTCRARAEYNLDLAKLEFRKPPELSDKEVAEILGRLDELTAWAKDIQDYALNAAVVDGVVFDGWKVVEGRSNRKYVDEKAAAEVVMEEGYTEEQVYNKKIKGITDMEKLLGKNHFAELLKDYVIKPEGKPTLVPESDKRPAMNTAEKAAQDFKEEL